MATLTRTKTVAAGNWRMLDWFLGAFNAARFFDPAGARIKVRFSLG